MLAGRLPHQFFRGLLSVDSRYGLPARQTAEAACCLEGSDALVTSAAAPVVRNIGRRNGHRGSSEAH